MIEHMKRRITRAMKQLLSQNRNEDGIGEESRDSGWDLREEYANAFRTESYNQFWERVLELSKGKHVPVTHTTVGSTASSRLPSYRLFVEHLLDPDQPTVSRILALTQTRPECQALLTDYFLETANASFLCSNLLRDVDQTRMKYKSLLKATPDSLSIAFPTRLSEFSESHNPFVASAPSSQRIQAVRDNCSDLLKRLESVRDKTQAKSQLIRKLKCGSAVVAVVLTASLTIVVAVHALAVVLAAPCVVAFTSLELVSAKNLARRSAQMDEAAKGAYILMRDLDTISRLAGRLGDELEHIHGRIGFWLGRGGDAPNRLRQASGEVARQLRMGDVGFSDQLDELEEHLYLCFMTINRARNLVLQEIQNVPPPQPPPASTSSG